MPPPAPARSLLLALYLAASRRAGGVARWALERRRATGKEDPERLSERTGLAGAPRPDGPLAWFHAASVGESASLLEMLRRLHDRRPELTCLVTTGTVTSARFMADRLPEGCIHQFAPVDVLPWVRRFLEHWRPDLAIWTESELWPATIWETRRRGIPMLLINARISARSYRRWRLMRGAARALLGRFERILAQDALAGEHLRALGADPARLTVTGTLKEGAAPLPDNEAERARITRGLAGRPVWLAASTHPGEEDIALAAHKAARRAAPLLVLILAPRHPDRGDAVAGLVGGHGLSLARRTAGETPGPDTEVYLADTLGEMGIWYRIAPVSFVGGSLVPIGGHNPFEPALLGSAILHGPFVTNFAEPYRRLRRAGASLEVSSEAELAEALVSTLAPDQAASMAAAAWEACSEGAEVTDAVLDAIDALLEPAP